MLGEAIKVCTLLAVIFIPVTIVNRKRIVKVCREIWEEAHGR